MKYPLAFVTAALVALTGCRLKEGDNPWMALLLQNSFSGGTNVSQSVSIVDGSGNLTGPTQGTAPYFHAVSFTPTQLADAATFPNQISLSNVPIYSKDGGTLIETASFTGVPLSDLLIRGAQFRPKDKGNDGRATIVTATGVDGYRAVFSFTELIRTAPGSKTLVVYRKNGAPLSSSEGMVALLAAGDTGTGLRYVRWLMTLAVENLWINQGSGSATSAFTIQGDVNTPAGVDATTFSGGSAPSSYFLQNVGPISGSGNYYWGQGAHLGELLNLAGLKYPNELNRCYVVVTSADQYRNTWSCGELFNSPVGIGDNNTTRSRTQGVVVIDPNQAFLSQTGTSPSACTADPATGGACNGTSDPAQQASYTTSRSGEFITILSTGDTVPFAFPGGTATVNLGPRHTSWISSVTVAYK